MADEKQQDVMEEAVEETVEEKVENEEVEEAAADEAVDTETAGEEAESTEESDDTEEAEGEKKGFFKQKQDKKDEVIEELNDKVKRQMAEFDNFRKRTEKEKTQMFDMGARTIVETILPVIDNFERGFTTVEESDKQDAFVEGMDKVYKQLVTELEAAGVKPIECIGKEFDPEFHNAVMQVESEEFESGIVAQELLKGYTYKDTVVRHSMVAVVS